MLAEMSSGYSENSKKGNTPNLDLGCQKGVKSLSRVQLFATPWTVAY